jgi:hypothetical protein
VCARVCIYIYILCAFLILNIPIYFLSQTLFPQFSIVKIRVLHIVKVKVSVKSNQHSSICCYCCSRVFLRWMILIFNALICCFSEVLRFWCLFCRIQSFDWWTYSIWCCSSSCWISSYGRFSSTPGLFEFFRLEIYVVWWNSSFCCFDWMFLWFVCFACGCLDTRTHSRWNFWEH